MPLGANPGASQVLEDDDDLYFDDGEFGDLDADVADEGEKFDESIFDDETSHLYDRKKKAAPDTSGEQQVARLEESSEEEGLGNLACRTGALGHAPSMASNYRAGLQTSGSLSERARDAGSAKVHGGVLSEHNLEALHNALTKAGFYLPPEIISIHILNGYNNSQWGQFMIIKETKDKVDKSLDDKSDESVEE